MRFTIRFVTGIFILMTALSSCQKKAENGSGFILAILASTVPMAPVTGTFSIGGRVSGLVSGESLTLLNNGGDPTTVNANGNFTFGTGVTGAYAVTIQTQPGSLRCIVQGGSGTAAANVTDIVVTCPMAAKNGLVWIRCTHGQQWNATAGDCTATGAANSYGAILVRYCPTNDNACNSASNSGLLSSGAVYQACSGLNAGSGTYGIQTWRVPTKDESKGLVVCSDGTTTPLKDYPADPYKCGWTGTGYSNSGWTAPALDAALFPNSMSLEYWTATPDSAQASSAWYTAFQNGWTHMAVKSGQSYVRCVSGP
jgi:hypothetical protein